MSLTRFRLAPKSTTLDLEGSLCILFQNSCAMVLLYLLSVQYNTLPRTEYSHLQRRVSVCVCVRALVFGGRISRKPLEIKGSVSMTICKMANRTVV